MRKARRKKKSCLTFGDIIFGSHVRKASLQENIMQRRKLNKVIILKKKKIKK